MNRVALLMLGLMSSLTTQAQGFDRVTGAAHASRSEVIATHGMVATSQPLATQVGLDILKAGGSAVDAAIAANATLGLMEPTGCGIGGDLFAIVWDAGKGELTGLNASGRSPESLTLQHFRDLGIKEIPYLGPLSVSVPGAVDGWYELHERYGRLPMSDLLAPAIRYAEEGFPVTQFIADLWADNVESRKDFSGVREIYMPGGAAPKTGDIFSNPNLANTYKKIAAGGRDAFYKGDIAKTIDAYMAEQGGYLAYDDLAKHTSEWVKPLGTNYRGYDVYELPPNGQGVVTLQMLNILEAYDLRGMGFGSKEYLHTLIEAKKVAYEDRAKFYADPAFYNAPMDMILSKEYADERRKLIADDKAATTYPPGDAKLETGDTIYLTVADKDGNMISLIQSNYGDLGSGMTPAELGFQLQNRGALFSLEDGHANVYEPGKRPFHTIIPAFVMKDGKPWLSFGLMGGAMQPQGHAQIVVNIVDFGMGVQEAGDVARYHHKGHTEPFRTGFKMSDGGILEVESGVSPDVVAALEARGHVVEYTKGPFGGYQAILFDAASGVYRGASEMRKDGTAIGY